MLTIFGLKTLKGRDHLVSLGVDAKIILEWMSGNRLGGMDWIHLAQDRDQLWALMNMIVNLD
jgi:hypothetical protein